MDTEGQLHRYRGADAWPTAESLGAMLDSQMSAYHAVRNALPSIADAVRAIGMRLGEGEGRLVYCGAGASARLAVQDGVELYPTFGWPHARLLYIIAGGQEALTRSVEGAEDDEDAAAAAVAGHALGREDVLIAVAASGQTPFTCRLLEDAGIRGCLTIGMANNPGSRLLRSAAHPVLLPTGAEFLAGSTRMIAGTAQKIALNLLSTQLMMDMGRVHDGLMVDLVAGNEKLIARSARIVAAIANCGEAEAQAALRQADGHIKTSIMILQGLTPEEARLRLQRFAGRLRPALEEVAGEAVRGTTPPGGQS